MTYVVIIFMTSGFWVSLLAHTFFKEPVHLLEIVGLVVCFISVVIITLNSSKNNASGGQKVS